MKDIAIIGAGPVGIYAATCAGLRGLDGYLLEANETIGGQPEGMYAQKHVYDFPGEYQITGSELVAKLNKQYENYSDKIELKTNTQAQNIEKTEDG
jgi:thioredoxin reductase (NADPH)